MNSKKSLVFIAMAIILNTGLWAQGYPVMDISNIVASLQNGYTMIQQLQALYSTIKTSYDQLQQQIKSFESFDFNSLDARDPLGSWRSLNTYANRMITYEGNIESIINRKDIKIGGSSYSLGDLFTAPPPKTVRNMAVEGFNFVAIDPFEKKLSPEERAAFHQRYGMTYGNSTRLRQMGESLQKKAAEIVGYSTSLQHNLEEDREKLSSITSDLFDSESTVQQQQINNAVMSIMAQDVKTQANLLGSIAQQIAVSTAQIQLEKQALMDEININDLNFADGLLKMLNDMPQIDDYR